jgi:hypothetical protein
LPQSLKIGLLTSTMVWKNLFFVWLITITQLTFSLLNPLVGANQHVCKIVFETSIMQVKV